MIRVIPLIDAIFKIKGTSCPVTSYVLSAMAASRTKIRPPEPSPS